MMRNRRTAVSETAVSTKDAKQHTGYWFAAILLFFWFLIPAPLTGGTPGGDFEFNLSNGYRLGGLHWSIASPGGDPNIRSELTWSKLEILQIEGEGKINIERFTIRAVLGFGLILAGDARDSDYDSDNRTDEWSRSYSDATGGYILHALTGLGYRYEFRAAPITLLPMIGVALHRQAMVMSDGVQVVSVSPHLPPAEPVGPIAGLDSSYAANWLNIWIGLDAAYRVANRVNIGASVSFHPSLYYALADWNLRTDLAHPVSFVHRAFGLGLCGELSVGVKMSRHFLLEGRCGLDYWFGGPGVDETYSAAGYSVETQLNEVVWNSAQFYIGTVLRL
jgi:hypothetical protein